ncbi:MAG: hypothetical protein VX834_12725, partial [Myxococcota bacterium]|nr:hypothetical protein [Myxococcota bacterium]
MRHVGLTSMTALALTMLISTLVTPVALADSTPPTIVVNGKIAECRYPTTTVELDPTVSDNADPLPQYWFDTPNDTDPDEYPIGTHLVTVYARDNQNNESSQTTTVLVQDTLAPTVMFDSNPPGCIASATSVSCECTSPDGSVLNINQSQFLVTDLCSQNPVAVFSFPDDNFYPYGSTEVTAQVFDTYGNTDTEIVTVNVIDQTPPVLEAIPSSFTVPSASGECTTANSVDGTIVRLPRPSATDACSTANQIAYTWTSDHFNESIDPVQCLPNGTHTIIPTIYDNYGNQPPEGSLPTFNVTVTDPSNLNLTLSATGPSGFHQDAQSVTASIDGAPGGSATWTAIAGQVPDEGSNQTLAASDSVNFTFSYEEVYCPVYLSVIVGGDSGADTSVCFAIDRTSPNHNFAGVGTTRISDSNPNLTIDVEADNSSTWPIFYYGEKLTLEFDALDEDGQVSSGISSVAIDVLNADTGATVGQVLNQTAECNEGELAGCPTTMRIEGCDADSELCINNRLAFGRIGRGNFKLQITVTDGAGNASSSAYPFTVGNLSDNLATQVNWINNVRETATLAARGLLDQAAGLLNSASYLFEYSPGHAFILCETALQRLNEADTAGASIGSMREVLAKGVISEVRRIWEVHNEAFEAGSLQDWSILSNYTPDPDGDPVFDFTTETYKTRAFLVGATPQNELYPDKDHLVQIADTLELSSVELSRADELEDLGDKLDFAVRAFDSLVMLFDDQTYADLFGRPVYQTSVETDDDDNAVPYKNERYFRGNPPA